MPKRPLGQGLTPIETIERQIFVLRGHRVMLDRDLAELYGVELKRLNEQVKRNRDRFPDDFMFQVTLEEGRAVVLSSSQIATLKRGENIKYRPYAFTEHGAVMLANVLRSPVAARASIQVVRAFVNIRRMLATNEELAGRSMLSNVGWASTMPNYKLRILRKLLEPPSAPPKRPIGFIPPRSEKK